MREDPMHVVRSKGSDPEGAEPKGAEPKGAQPKGAEPKGAEPRGPELRGSDPRNPIQEVGSEGARFGRSEQTNEQTSKTKESKRKVPEWPSIGNAESQNGRAAPSTTGNGVPNRPSEGAIHLPSATATLNESK